MLLEVDVARPHRAPRRNQLRDDVRRVLRETARVAAGRHPGSRRAASRSASPTPPSAPGPAEAARAVAADLRTPSSARAAAATSTSPSSPDGLIQLDLTEQGVNERVRRAVDQAIEVLRRRVDALGTTEPNIQRQGADRILVQVPGLQDPQRLKEILGQTAKLEFRMLAEPGAADVDLLPSKETRRPARAGRAPRHRRGRRPHRRAARLRPAHQRADRQLPLQHARRAALRPGDDRERRPAARDRARQRGDLGAAHPVSRSPAARARSPAASRCSRQTTCRCCCAPARLPAKLTIVEERTVGPGLGQDSIEAGKMATYVATVLRRRSSCSRPTACSASSPTSRCWSMSA